MFYTIGLPQTERRGGVFVRLTEDARRIVVFIGIRTANESGKQTVFYVGTAFFVQRANFCYLITARHVVDCLNGRPFVIGCNDKDGQLTEIDIDHAVWVFHDDETVDLAATNAGLTDADWLPLGTNWFATHGARVQGNFGIGDLAYIVGLYRLFPGSGRILPIVHTGHIAMMPHEKIPMENRVTKKITHVDGYLVEAQTLEGLSGSPVFVRYTDTGMVGVEGRRVAAYTPEVYLLGLWAGAWDAPAGQTLVEQIGKQARVPVGMGVTVPSGKIFELLNSDHFRKQRADILAEQDATNAVSQDAFFGAQRGRAAIADNPNHQEDFTALLNAAARKREQER
jgi:hypothetical protein